MTFLFFYGYLVSCERSLRTLLCPSLFLFTSREINNIKERYRVCRENCGFFSPIHCNPSPTCVGEPIMPARDLSAGVKEVVKLFKNIIFLNSPYQNISWMRSTSTSPICGGAAMVSVNIISTRSPIKLGPIQQPEPLKEKK